MVNFLWSKGQQKFFFCGIARESTDQYQIAAAFVLRFACFAAGNT
jgi:hypothetical protein